MSSQQDQTSAAGQDRPSQQAVPARMTGPVGPGRAGPGAARPDQQNPWKTTADGTTAFRRMGPVVVWWVWIAFVIFNFADVVIPDHDYFSAELAVGLLTVTGVAYACCLRPRVLADDEKLLVRNPIQDHRIPWGAISDVFLGDSVELSCSRTAAKKDKTVFCWALYSGRRSRMRYQTQRQLVSLRSQPGGGTPAAPPRQDSTELIAKELGRRVTQARERGTGQAVATATLAWLPLAVMLVPAAALLGLLLAK